MQLVYDLSKKVIGVYEMNGGKSDAASAASIAIDSKAYTDLINLLKPDKKN